MIFVVARQRFRPGPPNVAWCQDITSIPTGQGWLFLASVLDLGSRRLIGYAMAEHMRTELVLDALNMAVTARGANTTSPVWVPETHPRRSDAISRGATDIAWWSRLIVAHGGAAVGPLCGGYTQDSRG